jgi:uncharacterized RDD family membrane protein YckC
MGRSGFWIRLAATAIDAVVFIVFAVSVGAVVAVLEERGTLTESKQNALEALLVALWLAYTSMEALLGATAGKLVTGIVITLPDGAPAPPWTRILRWTTKQGGSWLMLAYLLSDQLAFYYLGGVLNGALLLGVLRMLDEEKRAWHDYWTHTAVVTRKHAAAMAAVHEEPVGLPPPT